MKRSRIAIKLTVFIFLVVGCAGSFLPSVFAADEATEIKAKYAKLLADYSQFVLHPTAKSPSATEFALKNNIVSALPGFPWVADLLMSFPEGTNEGYGPIFSDSRADRALVC